MELQYTLILEESRNCSLHCLTWKQEELEVLNTKKIEFLELKKF